MGQLLLVAGTVVLMAFFSLIFGNTLERKFVDKETKISAESYFLGFATIVVALRCIFIVVDSLEASLLIFFCFSVFVIVMFFDRKVYFVRVSKARIMGALVIGLVLSLYLMMTLVPITEYDVSNSGGLNPWAGNTNLVHGFRASNISLMAYELDIFPVLNQNVAQSLLAILVLQFTGAAPLGVFTLQMATTLFFLTWLISRTLIKLGISSKRAFFFSILVLFMNSSFGGSYFSSTDAGSSLILVRNHDVLLGIGIFLTVLLKFAEICNSLESILRNKSSLIPLIILSASFALVFGSYAFFIPVLIFSWPSNARNFSSCRTDSMSDLFNIRKFQFRERLGVAFILGASYGSLALISGFLMIGPRNLDVIPSSDRGSLKLGINDLLHPRSFTWPREAWYPFDVETPAWLGDTISFLTVDFFEPNGLMAAGVSSVFEFLKIILVCLLIFLLSGYVLKFRRLELSSFSTFWLRSSTISFALGVLIVKLVKVGENGSLNNELTRFLQLGIFMLFIASVPLSQIAINRVKEWKSISKKAVGYAIVASFFFFSSLPVVSEISRILNGNLGLKESRSYFGCASPSLIESPVIDLKGRVVYLLNSKKVEKTTGC